MPLFTDVILSNGRVLLLFGKHTNILFQSARIPKLDQQRLSILDWEVALTLFCCFGRNREL